MMAATPPALRICADNHFGLAPKMAFRPPEKTMSAIRPAMK